MKEEETREERPDRLEQKAGDYEELFGSCAQGTLLALQEEFGGCNCRHVQHHIFGRSFVLTNPKDQVEFVGANASKRCRAPAGKAARIAGELILKGRNV